ncbi:MAG: ThiF family adenylyltransferase [Hyphomonadaceae bacterium]
MTFTYNEFTTRNIGFVTTDDQSKLRAAHVFIPGVGGMGAACLLSLARAGIEHFTIADLDVFEVSNLNRQVFAFLDTVGKDKAASAAEAILRINPEIKVDVLGKEWLERVDTLAASHPVIVNGTDDTQASVALYRAAKAVGASVVDAYASPLPSVYVVRPGDLRPEERLGYPTVGKDWRQITDEDRAASFMKELEWVLVHSSAHKHVDLGVAAELAAGKRKRFSFAPMVITTGNLMAYEVIRLILGRSGGADHRGYFLNPHDLRIEKPLPWPVSAAKRTLVRTFIRKMMG